MRMWRALIIVALFACPVPSQAHELSLTLDEALARAREQNPELLAARRELEIARSRLVKAEYLNQFNPEISGSVARRDFADRSGGSTDFDVMLSQELEIAGQRGKRIEEATRNLDKVTQQVKDKERLILAAVKDAFYRILYLQRRLALFQDVEGLNRRLQGVATKRFQAGDVPKMDANVAEIRLGQARKDTLVAGRDYRGALRDLERLVGMEPVGQITLTGELAVQPQTFEQDELVRLALDTRPDLQAAKLEQQRVHSEIALTRRSILPNPTLQGFYREEEGGEMIIGGGLSVPLPLFDRKQAELMQLTERVSQAGYEQQGADLRVQQEVRDAFRGYEAATEMITVFEQTVLERATENSQLMEIAYREGKIDLLDALMVQDDLVKAQSSYVDSLWEYWQARTALERAVGRDL